MAVPGILEGPDGRERRIAQPAQKIGIGQPDAEHGVDQPAAERDFRCRRYPVIWQAVPGGKRQNFDVRMKEADCLGQHGRTLVVTRHVQDGTLARCTRKRPGHLAVEPFRRTGHNHLAWRGDSLFQLVRRHLYIPEKRFIETSCKHLFKQA